MPAVADHASMRRGNRDLVLSLLRQRRRVSRADLAKATALAKPTISTIVEELIAAGLAREVGVGITTSSGGRPPIMLEFNERSEFLAGIHIGVRRTTVVIADALGVELRRVSVDTQTPRSRSAGSTLRRVAAAAAECAAAAGALDALTSVGVTVPGLVDGRGVCRLAPNLGWRDVDVAALLAAELRLPVFVHNTAQAVAVSERLVGAARGSDEVAVLYAGSGLGSGVLSRGRLATGFGGLAGELGHCGLPGGTLPCRCGKTGCIETIASGWALTRDAQALVAAGVSSTALGSDDVTPAAIGLAAANGDEVARDLLVATGRALGVAASWLINMVNPEVLVLAGGLLETGPWLVDALVETAAAQALPEAWAGTNIRFSELGASAEVRGAVILAMQHAEASYRLLFTA